jgi:hypothetical protein
MSYRIVMSSFAAIAIGLSCMATDASARGGGGGGGGGGSGGGGKSGGPASGVIARPTGGGAAATAHYYGPVFIKSAAPNVRWIGSTGSFPGGTVGGGGKGKFYRATVGDPPSIKGGDTGTFGATPGSSGSPTSGINAGDPAGGGATGVPGGSVAAGAGFYAPASYNSNAACGRYPYPPCNAVCGRYPYPHCNKVPTQ